MCTPALDLKRAIQTEKLEQCVSRSSRGTNFHEGQSASKVEVAKDNRDLKIARGTATTRNNGLRKTLRRRSKSAQMSASTERGRTQTTGDERSESKPSSPLGRARTFRERESSRRSYLALLFISC